LATTLPQESSMLRRRRNEGWHRGGDARHSQASNARRLRVGAPTLPMGRLSVPPGARHAQGRRLRPARYPTMGNDRDLRTGRRIHWGPIAGADRGIPRSHTAAHRADREGGNAEGQNQSTIVDGARRLIYSDDLGSTMIHLPTRDRWGLPNRGRGTHCPLPRSATNGRQHE